MMYMHDDAMRLNNFAISTEVNTKNRYNCRKFKSISKCYIDHHISHDVEISKLTLIRVLYGFLVDRPFQAIYQDEQLAPNLKLIT